MSELTMDVAIAVIDYFQTREGELTNQFTTRVAEFIMIHYNPIPYTWNKERMFSIIEIVLCFV